MYTLPRLRIDGAVVAALIALLFAAFWHVNDKHNKWKDKPVKGPLHRFGQRLTVKLRIPVLEPVGRASAVLTKLHTRQQDCLIRYQVMESLSARGDGRLKNRRMISYDFR